MWCPWAPAQVRSPHEGAGHWSPRSAAGTLNKRSVSRNQRVVNNHDNMVKDYSRKRWLILSLLSVEIDMLVTWLCPLDLEYREVVAGQVGKEAAKQLDEVIKRRDEVRTLNIFTGFPNIFVRFV